MWRLMVLMPLLLLSSGCSRRTAEEQATDDQAAKFAENMTGIVHEDKE